jgi:hypothetical protein
VKVPEYLLTSFKMPPLGALRSSEKRAVQINKKCLSRSTPKRLLN